MDSREVHWWRLPTAAIAASTLLLLSACAGGAGGGDEGPEAEGFAHGAPQADVDAAIAELDPTTIVFQASAASPNSPVAESNLAFAEEVERRSGGKISVETHYGHPIADHTEIFDALADGRVDVSYTNPAYEPDLFPAFDKLVSITSSLPESPMAGELVAIGALTELAWSSEQIREDFEAQGLFPLVPVNPPGAYFSLCGQSGASLDDWSGRQVRIGSTVHSDLVSSMGGTPVSLDYLETYEALQRKTIDCTMIVMSAAVESGYFETAPHMQYTGGQALPRVFGSMLAGSNVATMPLPYQQIIFDAWQESHYLTISRVPADNLAAVKSAKENGGEIETFEDPVLDLIDENLRTSMIGAADSGMLGGDVEERMAGIVDEWETAVSEMGYEDGGTLTDMDEWFDEAQFDPNPYVDLLYDKVILNHRPS